MEEEIKWFLSLSSLQRKIFLAELIHGMTIAMRVVCNAGEGEKLGLERACALNESIHATSKYLVGICSGNENERWINPTFKSVFLTKDPVLLQQINQSWLYAKQTVSATDR
jgi:hypothetical protein